MSDGALALRLNCTACNAFTEPVKEGPNKVSCGREDCGKYHSTKSLWMVDLDKDYDRDEAGTLLELPP